MVVVTVATLGDIDAEEKDLNAAEARFLTASREQIPERRFGFSVTGRDQEAALQRRKDAQDALKQIADRRKVLADARAALLAQQSEQEQATKLQKYYNAGRKGQFVNLSGLTKSQRRAYEEGQQSTEGKKTLFNKDKGDSVYVNGQGFSVAPVNQQAFIEKMTGNQTTNNVTDWAYNGIPESYPPQIDNRQSFAQQAKDYADVNKYLKSGGIDIHESVTQKVQKGLYSDINKFFGEPKPRKDIAVYLKPRLTDIPRITKEYARGGVKGVANVAIGLTYGAEVLTDPTFKAQRNALNVINKTLQSPPYLESVAVNTSKQIGTSFIREPLAFPVTFTVENYLYAKMLEPGIRYFKEPIVVKKEIPEPQFTSEALVKAYQQGDLMGATGEFSIKGIRGPGIITTIPRYAKWLPLRPTNDVFSGLAKDIRIPQTIAYVRQEPFIVKDFQVTGALENPARLPVSIMGTKTVRTRTRLYSYEAVTGGETDLLKVSADELNANMRASLKRIRSYAVPGFAERDFVKGTTLTAGEVITTEKPIINKGINFKNSPKISRIELTTLKSPESVLIEFDNAYGLIERAKYKELIGGVDITYPRLPKVSDFNIREFTIGRSKIKEIRLFEYPKITERAPRKVTLIQGQTETRFYNLPEPRTETNMQRFTKVNKAEGVAQTSVNEIPKISKVSPELKEFAKRAQIETKGRAITSAVKLNKIMSRISVTQYLPQANLGVSRYAGTGLYETTAEIAIQTPQSKEVNSVLPKTITFTSMPTRFISVPKEITRGTTREITRTTSRALPRELTRTIPKEATVTIPKSIARELLRQTPRTVTRTVTRFVPRTPTRAMVAQVIPPKIGGGKPPKGSVNAFSGFGNSISKAFRTYIIRRRSKIFLPGLRPKAAALYVGYQKTLSTPAATFGVIGTEQSISAKGGMFAVPNKYFRSYKIKKGRKIALQDVYIQRTKQEGGVPRGRFAFPIEQRLTRLGL